MLNLPGYFAVELLHESSNSRVYRARDRRTSTPVILKTPSQLRPDAQRLARLRHEFQLLQGFDSPLFPRALALADQDGSLAIVCEDIGGESLDRLASGRPVPLEEFFALALPLTEALAYLHRHRLVHRDIKPHNIVRRVEPGLGSRVQLIDFGMASPLAHERAPLEPPERLEGTLAYIAPEQTGRMNRAIDHRTDFYALGVTLYELLTGHRPFAANDALEMVHAHLARAPQPPVERAAGVPQVLSDIVLKLLSKLAEDRYQSAEGLLADLLRCATQWRAEGRITPFEPGTSDFSNQLRLPQRLYGREPQIELLLGAFERVATQGRPELVLVAGYSGIGKSALVAELHKPIVARRGAFAAAKFDQYPGGQPYATVGRALQSLVRQLLARSDAQVAASGERLRLALGSGAQALIELVPQLGLIVGPQPPLDELPPLQALHRLRQAASSFIAACARCGPSARAFHRRSAMGRCRESRADRTDLRRAGGPPARDRRLSGRRGRGRAPAQHELERLAPARRSGA